MGTVLKSIAINSSSGRKGVVELVSKTAEHCLFKAGVDMNDLGMLVNTGVYSENHLLEPALATLIQKQLKKKQKPAKKKLELRESLLSFDLHNGGGGIINALQVVDGFIGSGEIEYGLIVSGDVKPKIGMVENYNYATSAAAVLLSNDKKEQGFIRFKAETFPEFKDDISSSTTWVEGNLHFVHKNKSDYLENAVNCSLEVLHNFLNEEHLSWSDIDYVFTSQSPKGFASKLQKKLNDNNKIVCLNNEEEIYSSGLLYSMNHIFEKEEFVNAKNFLLITVGAGITVSLAYYKNE